jgi:hypothetical protein
MQQTKNDNPIVRFVKLVHDDIPGPGDHKFAGAFQAAPRPIRGIVASIAKRLSTASATRVAAAGLPSLSHSIILR